MSKNNLTTGEKVRHNTVYPTPNYRDMARLLSVGGISLSAMNLALYAVPSPLCTRVATALTGSSSFVNGLGRENPSVTSNIAAGLGGVSSVMACVKRISPNKSLAVALAALGVRMGERAWQEYVGEREEAAPDQPDL